MWNGCEGVQGEKFLSTSKQNSVIEAIDDIGDVEEEDTDEDAIAHSSKVKLFRYIYIPCSLMYCTAYCVVYDHLLGRWCQSGGCDAASQLQWLYEMWR